MTRTAKLLTTLLFAAVVIPAAYAHTIGGAYARLISCQWGQFGYQYGHIGTYEVNGQIIRQFFGSSYCPS
jgi:hypothetical protein